MTILDQDASEIVDASEEPRGRERFYHLDPRPLADAEKWLAAFTKFWKQRMVALEELVGAEEDRR